MRRLTITARPAALALASALVVAAASGAAVLVAYAVSPTFALGLFAGAGVLAAVAVRPMLGLYLGVLAAPFDNVSVSLGGFGGLSASEAILLAAGAAATVRGLLARRSAFSLDAAHLAFLALLVIAGAGVVVATDPYVVARIVVTWSMLLALSVLVARSEAAERRTLLTVIAITGAVLGAMAIPAAGRIQLMGGGEVAANRAAASFTSPNILAFFLVLALAPGLSLALRSRGATRLVMCVATALVAAGLALTLSRGAIIGAACSIAVMFVSPTFRRVMAILLVLVAVALVVDGGRVVGSREVSIVRTRLSTLGEESQTNPRLQIYRAAPTIIGDHPLLGIGEGNFPSASAQYGLRDIGGDVFQHAHNLPLTIAIETGLLGLGAFVGFLIALARPLIRVLRSRAPEDRSLGIGVAAALIGLFVTSMTDYPLRSNVIMAVIMAEVGALIAYGRAARTTSMPEQR